MKIINKLIAVTKNTSTETLNAVVLGDLDRMQWVKKSHKMFSVFIVLLFIIFIFIVVQFQSNVIGSDVSPKFQ